MSFYLCTSYRMRLIDELVRYVEHYTTIWKKSIGSDLSIYDMYSDVWYLYCKSNGYKNWIIDKMIEKKIIMPPMAIKSPRKMARKPNGGILWQWLYYSFWWYIYYDVGMTEVFNQTEELEINTVWLTDGIVLALLSWKLWEIIDANEDLLRIKLSWWNLSATPSTIESAEQENLISQPNSLPS